MRTLLSKHILVRYWDTFITLHIYLESIQIGALLSIYMSMQSRVTNCFTAGPITMYYEDAAVVCMPL